MNKIKKLLKLVVKLIYNILLCIAIIPFILLSMIIFVIQCKFSPKKIKAEWKERNKWETNFKEFCKKEKDEKMYN